MAGYDITIGFKLLSGYYIGGISKDDLTILSKSKEINWNNLEFEDRVNKMKVELLKSDTFKFWASWKKSLMNLTSQAVGINFLLLSLKDWERKGMPTNATSTQHKQFIKNSIILLDRSIYEYVTNMWRGSSDSKVKFNLNSLKDMVEDVFTPVSEEKWDELITEIIEYGSICGKVYSNKPSIDSKIKLILLYYYTIKEISGPDFSVVKDYDFDHIISKSEISSSVDKDSKQNISHILNICALPRRENICKGDKSLDQISEAWLVQQIEKYAEVPQNEFSNFSKPSNMNDLLKFRKDKFKDEFIEKRKNIIHS